MFETWSRSDLLNLFAIIIPTTIGIITGIFGIIYSQFIKHEATRIDIIDWLNNSIQLQRYNKLIKFLESYLSDFFGESLSLEAFNKSLFLSYLYTVIFFLFSYSYTNGFNRFDQVTILPEDDEWKFIYLPAALLFVGLIQLAWHPLENLDIFLTKRRIEKRYKESHARGLLEEGLVKYAGKSGIPMPFKFALFFAIPSIIAAIAMSIFNSHTASIIIIGILVTFSILFAVNGVGTLLISFIFSGPLMIYSISKSHEWTVLFIIFLFCLPIVNAILDWFSWSVSRYFIKKASVETSAYKIILDIFYDFVAGIILMLILCTAMPLAIEVSNNIYASFYDINVTLIKWEPMALLAKEDPWGEGLMITLMLITTLIPTLIHIVAGLSSVLFHRAIREKLAKYLSKANSSDSNLIPFISTLYIEIYLFLILFLLGIIYILSLHAVNLPIAEYLYGFTSYIFRL